MRAARQRAVTLLKRVGIPDPDAGARTAFRTKCRAGCASAR